MTARLVGADDRTLAFLAKTVGERGYPPSIAEIQDALGFRSKSTVHRVLVRLEEQGRIRRGAGPRAITVVEAHQ